MQQHTQEEIWKPVVGYEGLYEVSDHGTVRSLPRTVRRGSGTLNVKGRVLSPAREPYGYPLVSLWKSGKSKMGRVHRLVLEAFVGPCPTGMEACHNNGDASDARLENLRWDTPKANKLDIVRHGNHFQAKKTHCPKGHPYSPENTMRSGGSRYCRTCHRERGRLVRSTK